MRPAYSLYRLQYDLAQLVDELPAGIRVVTDDSDMYVAHFHHHARVVAETFQQQVKVLLDPGTAGRSSQGMSYSFVDRSSSRLAMHSSQGAN